MTTNTTNTDANAANGAGLGVLNFIVGSSRIFYVHPCTLRVGVDDVSHLHFHLQIPDIQQQGNLS